ncbi:MAG: MdtA/MuxA family multidrug efflux RND transporter periplasmic adaptor subunit [Bryobacteraceae bacterium]
MKPPATLQPETEPRQPEPPPNRLPRLDLEDDSSSRSRWWVWLLVFAAIGYGCYRLYQFETAKSEALTAKKGAALRPRSIPVVAATASAGDMPVYLQGLGTVTAFNTVTVKSRIDGQLVNVAFHEGQFVHTGDLLAEIDPRPYQVALDQAQGNLARDQATLRDAEVNLERDQELYNNKIIAKQQLDTQAATVQQAHGSLVADQATIDNAKLNLSYTRITAPISGRVGLRLVDAGNMVHASDANGLVIIAQLQPIAVLFSIPQDQLPEVLRKLHQGAKLRTEAYDRNLTKKLGDGTLVTVDNQIDPTTGTSRLKAVFPNTDFALFPNQFVNVKLWLDTKHGAIIVPAVAIQRGPTAIGTFVYVVQDDNTVAMRQVKVGLNEGNNVSIDSGIQAGDRVVVDGAEKLTEGMKVTLRQGTSTPHRPTGSGGDQTQNGRGQTGNGAATQGH